MKWTEKELLQAAQTIKEYCHYIKNDNPNYEGGANCNYCIFGEKEILEQIKGAKSTYSVVRKKARCMLQDNYGKQNPWLWPLDKVQIDDNTLF